MLLSTAMGVFNIEVTMLLATPLAVSYNEIRQQLFHINININVSTALASAILMYPEVTITSLLATPLARSYNEIRYVLIHFDVEY